MEESWELSQTVQPQIKPSWNITHNSQKMEIIQMSIDRGMDKQNVVNILHILFSLKNKWNSDTCYNMHEAWKHYAKWNKPVKKDKYCMIPHM